MFDHSIANQPLFHTNTPTNNNGTYVLIRTDHGQGTAQFLFRILLGGVIFVINTAVQIIIPGTSTMQPINAKKILMKL